MEITSTENSDSISDLEILEIMDTVEEIIDSEPDRPFTFRVTTAAETPTPGVTRKILYIGKSALETLKVLSSLTRSYKSPTLANLIGRPAVSSRFPLPGANTPTFADRAGNPDLRPELATGLDLAIAPSLPLALG
mgnify:CR=1 FL=1